LAPIATVDTIAPMPTELEKPAASESDRHEVKACPVDLSIQCPTCGTEMQPEHAHYRCLRCGYRDSCCM
jgi:tRNA(Ile2) C34 agmatinyltransferase TiaS